MSVGGATTTYMAKDAVEPFAGDPDHAWKTLTLVIDWIKHAETKAAATLAAAGVAGGVLYNLVKDESDPSWVLALASVITGVGVLVAGVCAGAAFWPRLRHREEPSSPLFFPTSLASTRPLRATKRSCRCSPARQRRSSKKSLSRSSGIARSRTASTSAPALPPSSPRGAGRSRVARPDLRLPVLGGLMDSN